MIKKAILYFVCITSALYGLRALHYHGLLKQKQGYYAKYRASFFEKNNFNILFLGSSRAEMHYDTRVFDSITGANSFNLGVKGATPHVAYAVLKAYLQNSAVPKELFYEVDYHFFKNPVKEILEFNNYFPFLKNKVLLAEFSKIDKRMPYFYYNPYLSFPYTGLKNLSTSIHGWLNRPTLTDSHYYKGHLKELLHPHLNFKKTSLSYSWFNITERNYLDSLIFLCKKNNTKISLVSSPLFAGGKLEVKNKTQVINQLKNIATIHNISFYDLSSLSFCNQRNLFVDNAHLNAAGSAKFTTFFACFYNNNTRANALK
ncbi:MAG: hypothetical protein ACXVNM_03075 [Bacteroidia bacterium]